MAADVGRARTLLVAECFGPTLQGEGPSTGQPAVFVRLACCNLSCRGCDTPYTWDWRRFDPRIESRRYSIAYLREWVSEQPSQLVVITGGEPLLQQDGLVALARSLTDLGRGVEVETNGTIRPRKELLDTVTRFNVSPKLSGFGAGMEETKRIKGDVLGFFAASSKAAFKFVVVEPSDLDEVVHWKTTLGLDPVWVMPEGTTCDAVLTRMSWLAEAAITRDLCLSTRLHVLLWDDARGR